MAKIVSPVWSIIRGSIAGTTYLTTPSGMIIGRQRTRPVNPGSTHQSYVRGALSKAAQQWQELTQEERDDWDTWAAGIGTFATGRQAMLSGQILFSYIDNCGVLPAGATQKLAAPDFADAPSIGYTYLDPQAGVGFGIKVHNYSSMEIMALIELSPMFEQTRNYFRGPFQPTQGTTVLQIPAASEDSTTWTNLMDSKIYFVRVRAVSEDDTAYLGGNVVSNTLIARCLSKPA